MRCRVYGLGLRVYLTVPGGEAKLRIPCSPTPPLTRGGGTGRRKDSGSSGILIGLSGVDCVSPPWADGVYGNPNVASVEMLSGTAASRVLPRDLRFRV